MSYRINFSIEERRDGIDADYREVGFGGTSAWGEINEAAYEMESMIANGLWETTGSAPAL